MTYQERMVLIVLCLVLGLGSMMQILLKTCPSFQGVMKDLESDKFHVKLNINTATKEDLVALPYIGEYTADRIISYREQKGGIQKLEELKTLKGIKENNYNIFAKYLVVK
jgi:competence ComEA-like helix-hairpin-helix protein